MISGTLNGPFAVCDMMRKPPSFFLSTLHQWKAGICIILTVHHIQYMCNLSASVKVAPAMISSALDGTSGWLWYAGLQQYIIYMWNLSISVKVAHPMTFSALKEQLAVLWYDKRTTKLRVEYPKSMESCDMQDSDSNLSLSVKAAPPMISGALNGPSGCLWYDERSTKLLGEYPTSMESCDMWDVNETSFIFVTSVHQSKWPLQWSPVHWMDHPAVCDTMRGLLSFLLSILYH